MQLVYFLFFVLLSALAFVNFDVCSIDFVMLLLNGVPFSIFVLKLFNGELKNGYQIVLKLYIKLC